MNERLEALLKKAEESLEAAGGLLRDGHFGFSASRSYYAMFYVAEALLLTRELVFSKHSAVISSYGKEFAKSGVLDPKFHAYLRDAFDVRGVADYDPVGRVTASSAEMALRHAAEFLQAARDYLRTSGE